MRKLLYTLSGIVFCLVFSPNLHAQSIHNIKIKELPATTVTELNKKYSKFQLKSIVKKEDEQKETVYEIKMQKKNKLVYLVYDSNGDLLSTKKLKMFSFDGSEPLKRTPTATDGHSHSH